MFSEYWARNDATDFDTSDFVLIFVSKFVAL